MDHHRRIAAVKEELQEREAEVFLAFGGPDAFYLSGFYTDSASNYPVVVVPADGDPTLYVSALDRSAADDAQIPVRRPDSKISDVLTEELEAADIVAGGSITLGLYHRLEERLSLSVDDEVLPELRMVKDGEELARIREAYRTAEAAIDAVGRDIQTGTERDVAAQLEYTMRMDGSNGTPFPTIVAAGTSSATPHHPTGDRDVAGPVLLDLGARIDGYVSDISRTLHLGEPDEQYRTVYTAVREAQAAAEAELAAGVPAAAVDEAARAVLSDAGFEDDFLHSTGHGVGIAVHEQPNLHAESEQELASGMVVTVEPGVYLEGAFGVRIEDAYHITESGAERLTTLSRRLEDNIIGV